jgi:signal transduction protein with GAF and PtsI domain
VCPSTYAVPADAYTDPRFDRTVDLQSGYHTRSLLCVPVRSHGAVVGVIQLINKTNGDFTEDDVTLTKLMATQIGAAVRSTLDFDAAARQHRVAGEEVHALRRQVRALRIQTQHGSMVHTGWVRSSNAWVCVGDCARSGSDARGLPRVHRRSRAVSPRAAPLPYTSEVLGCGLS